MASSDILATLSKTTSRYTYKEGDIPKFNRDNYAATYRGLIGAFVASNCIEYVTKAIPFLLEVRSNEVQFTKAVKKRAISIRLIYNLLEETFQN